MDLSQGGRRQRPPRNQRPPQPQLFDDTSNPTPPAAYGQLPFETGGVAHRGGVVNPPYSNVPQGNQGYDPSGQLYGGPPPPGPQQGMAYPGQNLLSDPMANMAMQYGQTLAGQGREIVNKNLEKYVSASKLKYYFAVDTTYVGKKLGLLFFPFLHQDWSVRYNQDEPVAPRYDVNAPDLYIPVMGLVTYILTAGVALGSSNKFTPEHLGMTCSTCLVWLVLEILVLLLSMYILHVTTDLKYLDLMAYCGYKYVGMIVILLSWLTFENSGYYIAWLWMSLCLGYFLVRALKMAIVPHSEHHGYGHGNKRRLYVLLLIALTQPVFMWWLTRQVVNQ